MFKQTAGEKLIELITVPVLVTVGRHDWITPQLLLRKILQGRFQIPLLLFSKTAGILRIVKKTKSI